MLALGTEVMKKNTDVNEIVASTLPPLIISSVVQTVSTPFMNACIDLQVATLPPTLLTHLSLSTESIHASSHCHGLFQ
jgi:hypothetical protein